MIIFCLRNRRHGRANNDMPAMEIVNPIFDRHELGNHELNLQPTQVGINTLMRFAEGYNIHIDTSTQGNQSQSEAAVVDQDDARPTAFSHTYARPDEAAVVGQERTGLTAAGYSYARPDGEIGVSNSAYNQPVYDEIPFQTEEESAAYDSPLPLLRNFETHAEHPGGWGPPLPRGHPILDAVQDISRAQTSRGNPEYRNLPPIANPTLAAQECHQPLSPPEYMHLQTDDVAVQSYQHLSAASTPSSSGVTNPFYDRHIHIGTSRNTSQGQLDEGDEYESMA